MVIPTARNRPLLIAIVVLALALVGILGVSTLLIPSTRPEFVLATKQQHFSCITFSPDGTKLLLAGWDAPAQIWDLSTRTRLLELSLKVGTYPAAFASDGQTFAIGNIDSTLTRWNLMGERQNPVGYHHSYVSGLAYSPDGKWLASSGHSDCTTRIWEASTGKRVHDLTGHYKWAGAVAFSPDSQRVASCDLASLRLWDTATGKLVKRFVTRQPMHYVAFSPDGKTIIGGGSYGSLWAWEVTTGNLIPGFSAPQGGASNGVFTPNGKYIVVQQLQSILLLEAATGRKVSALVGESLQERLPLWLRQMVPALQPPPAPYLCSMALSPDGKRLAYATEKEIRVIPCNFR